MVARSTSGSAAAPGPKKANGKYSTPAIAFNDDFEPTRSGLRSLLPSLSGLREWLNTGWSTPEALARSAAQPTRDRPQLEAARRAFASVLDDVPAPGARELARRAATAPSLRELWHLRNAIYSQVAVAHCESVAQRRMAALSPYFPASAGRPSALPTALRHTPGFTDQRPLA